MKMNKRALELSTTTIVAAVIALIILVVLIGIFTGRLNIYSSGVNELTTCKNTCKNIGYFDSQVLTEAECNSDFRSPSQIIPGKHSDVPEGKVCCCLQKK